ncbi:MAG: hypothetical protein AB7I42_07350 [Bradyrhizobium sp.]|uniref:hypothetical protein n=1 Tax=Bradyrhizobium sp. TaxID=376 RepID=UPI002A34A23C|nr:hypothetical protein [Bradyrhizobium sp.]
MGDEQSWRARLYRQAYSDFFVTPPPRADDVAYALAVIGHVIYRLCLAVAWITLNIGALPFGVWVEPPWRSYARFRLLQFPGRIPVISVALPLLLAWAAYRTFCAYGAWHVILPFAAIAVVATVSLLLLGGFNLLRRASRSRLRESVDQARELIS